MVNVVYLFDGGGGGLPNLYLVNRDMLFYNVLLCYISFFFNERQLFKIYIDKISLKKSN